MSESLKQRNSNLHSFESSNFCVNSSEMSNKQMEQISGSDSSCLERSSFSSKAECFVHTPTPQNKLFINHCGNSLENEIILSVYWKRGKLGAAYYTTYETELYILNDVLDIHPDFTNLKSLFNQVQFSHVITCTGLAESFTKMVLQLVSNCTIGDNQDINGETEVEHNLGRLHFLPGMKKEFNYDACRRYILGYRFGFEPKFVNEEDHLLYINTKIDLKKESMIMSLGILIKYLEKYMPQKNLSHDSFRISVLNYIDLDNLVSIDEASYHALQIFNVIHHPSAFKRSNSTYREGLSVFGIFNRCKSRIGSRRLRQIFTNPLKDIAELNHRFEAIEFCCKPQHEHIVKNLMDCIKKVDSVTGILASIYRSRANMNHWKSLYSSLYNAILIGQICLSHSGHSQLFLKIARSITKNVHEVAHYINHVIDFEESFQRDQFTVRVGIDHRLDMLRQTYAQVPDVLVKIAEIELEDLPEGIKECSIVYITELGYLLSVPIWKGTGSDTRDYFIPHFEVKFIVNKYVYYKTPRCAELDSVLGDILADMCRIESKIMVALMQFIHERVSDIVQVINLIAELDCIIAMSAIALENNYHRPVLTTERKLKIVKGRHPLQELCVENFVPNDTDFDGNSEVIKILTGPNSSGKSVYLKQIAIVAYLAHIGSFVPAQEATIGILDHIHSRIHTSESVSMRMSSFILDLKQMSYALYNSTQSSLIVVDEFGKGTTEIDGVSLLAASLIHFIQRKENCPFVVVSTHFHKLPKLLPPSPMLHLQYMDYMIENDEVIYLYRIKNGTCESSLSHLAAKSAGFGKRLTKRFLDIVSSSEKPLRPNPNLKITRTMIRHVKCMAHIIGQQCEQERESKRE